MLDDIETERENAAWRISETGPGVELLRRRKVEKLQKWMAAFYAHASYADLDALQMALELQEDGGLGDGATLVDAFQELFGA